MRMKRPSPALVISCLALFVALGGVSVAAVKLNGSQLKNRSVAGVKLKKDTLGKTEIKEEQIASATPVYSLTPGPFPTTNPGTFRTRGGPVLLEVSGSAHTAFAGNMIGMNVAVDGLYRGRIMMYANEAGVHMMLAPAAIPVTGLKAGVHTVSLRPWGGATATDLNDFVTVVAYEGAVALGQDEHEDGDDLRMGLASTDACDPALQSAGGVLNPGSDSDWRYSPYATNAAGVKIELTLTGGPVMDVYALGADTPFVANTKTFTKEHPTGTFEIRIHGPKAGAYVLKCRIIVPPSAVGGKPFLKLGERR